jgi:hypothetical protein
MPDILPLVMPEAGSSNISGEQSFLHVALDLTGISGFAFLVFLTLILKLTAL